MALDLEHLARRRARSTSPASASATSAPSRSPAPPAPPDSEQPPLAPAGSVAVDAEHACVAESHDAPGAQSLDEVHCLMHRPLAPQRNGVHDCGVPSGATDASESSLHLAVGRGTQRPVVQVLPAEQSASAVQSLRQPSAAHA